MLTLQTAQALLPGAQLVGRGDVAFQRVHSDTRTLRAGDLFVALRGEKFDANDFIAQAAQAGAVAALAERGLQGVLPGLQVEDSLAALQQLSTAWRQRFTLPLIAVTGSNGKTTVTQMIASILRAAFGDAAFATQGNLNNHIGVPLTLLRLRESHRAGVVGNDQVDVIEDRRQAIQLAIARAEPADVVLLAGKGHEEYQEINGQRLPFSDAVEARAALARRAAC